MDTNSKENLNEDNSDSFVGSYYFSDLWEIHATFRHYRCENFANRIRISSSSSCLESRGLQKHNNIEKDSHSSTQSAPPSPKSESKTNPQNGSNLTVKPKRLYQKNQNSSQSSVGAFIKKITRLRKPSPKPWIVIDIETHNFNDTNQEEITTPISRSQVVNNNQSHNLNDETYNSAQRSKSETVLQNIESTQRKSLQDSKSILKVGNKSINNEKPNQDQTQQQLSSSKDPKSSKSSYKQIIVSSKSLSPKRLTNPPHSLNLINKIVVINSQGLKSSSIMTSIDSIGNCSLDVNSDKPTLPPTHTPRSISDHTLKSVSLLDDNINKLNGKSPSLHLLKNGHRVPSYVGISCAISGYSNYNRYCSSLRNTCSRENSPTLRSLNQEPVKNPNDLRKNSLISDQLITSYQNGNQDLSELKQNNIKSNPKTNEKNSNSLLQQRIASLYGETFAAHWRESRIKCKSKLNDTSILDKIRSPSCPPTRPNDSIIDTHSKLLPAYDMIPTQIAEQLEAANEESANFDNSLMKPVADHEVVPSSRTTSFIEDSFAQSRASTEKDGNWFLAELNKTTIDIQRKIDLTEKLLEEQQQLMSDDISGKLRAAVGKANLLITQKFNQFKELCFKNISQSDCEQFKTTNDDLEGFWDLVSIQVIDIMETFNEIDYLCATGWKSDAPKKLLFSPSKPRSKKSTPKGSPDKSCDESSNGRDSERRNRLKEAKRKAKLNAAKNEDEITIFIPSNSKE